MAWIWNLSPWIIIITILLQSWICKNVPMTWLFLQLLIMINVYVWKFVSSYYFLSFRHLCFQKTCLYGTGQPFPAQSIWWVFLLISLGTWSWNIRLRIGGRGAILQVEETTCVKVWKSAPWGTIWAGCTGQPASSFPLDVALGMPAGAGLVEYLHSNKHKDS